MSHTSNVVLFNIYVSCIVVLFVLSWGFNTYGEPMLPSPVLHVERVEYFDASLNVLTHGGTAYSHGFYGAECHGTQRAYICANPGKVYIFSRERN